MKKIFISVLLIFGFLILASPSDSNAQTCATPPTDTGRVSMSVTVQGGTYRVWSRMKAADSTNNSFYVQIGENNCAELVGDAPITADRWTWVDYLGGSTTKKYEVTLPAGTHSVTLIGNEDGVGVDKLLMTTDLSCVPEGISGDNCVAETPDNDAPIISNTKAYEITATTAKITWDLDEYATGQVEYGTSPSLGSFTNKETSFNYNTHIQSLNGLTTSTTYYYRVISADASGNESVSETCSFTTGGATEQVCDSAPPATATPTDVPPATATPTSAPNDTTPPVISNPRVEEVTATSAKFRWELDENATGKTEYRPLGTSTWIPGGNETSFNYDYHIQALSGFTNGTTYEYRITSADASGNSTTSDICTFIAGGPATQACDSAPPATTTPAPTSAPNATTLNFQSIKLHGLGNGGDNTNPNAAGNPDPNRKSRDIAIELFDSGGNPLPTINSTINFGSNGVFSGIATLSDNVDTGNYLVKVKSPQFLKKQVTGIVNIVKGSETDIPTVSLTTGDIDNDNSISIFDYNILVDCYSDLLPAKDCSDDNKKLMADISDDGNVNASDYNLFLRELSVASGD